MIRVEHFLKENKRVLNELYFLECITVARNSDISISRLRNVIGKRYRELLDNFEELFPKTNTSIHFLFWGFLRAKIAAIFLDSEDSSKAQEVLLPCVNSSERCGLIGSLLHKIIEDDCLKVGCLAPEEVVIFNSIAGLLQTIFNVLAAIHVRYVQNKQYVTSFDDPMSWLCCAERVYRLYSKQNSFNTGPEFWDTLLCHKLYKEPEVNDFEDHNEPGLSIHRLMFEHGYTTTIFITAQVHQLAGEQSLSADYCQLTLLRQLIFAKPFEKALNNASFIRYNKRNRIKSTDRFQDFTKDRVLKQSLKTVCPLPLLYEFNSIEWAKNAISLSDYFSSIEGPNNGYYKTFECLLSALYIIEEAKSTCTRKEDKNVSDQLSNILANLFRDLVRIGLDLLEKGANIFQNLSNKENVNDEIQFNRLTKPKDDNKFGSMFNLDLRPIMARILESDVNRMTPTNQESSTYNEINSSTTLEIDNLVNSLVIPPTNYKMASRIFRLILHCIMKAEFYYTLQDHCTDAVTLIQNRSKAYRLMAIFENNIHRQCCMHKRRTDMLSDVLKQLNPSYYLSICSQLTFELAGTLNTLRDLKNIIFNQVSQKSGSESIHYARKFNDLTKRAISAYENFLNLNGISSNKTSLYFKESDIKPIVMACIYTARLYSQLISIDNMEKIQNLTKALNFYSQTVLLAENHIKHNSTTLIKSCEEIRIAKEMVSLLPIKLSRLSRGEIIPD